MDHPFTQKILEILARHFGTDGTTVFEVSPLLRYLNYKTRSADRGSKARSSFASLYALYVLVEDYLAHKFDTTGAYSQYRGADFTPLLRRMRALPFGQKLQNHALNNRVNDEFHRLFPEDARRPILRRVDVQKYWINESLLLVGVSGRTLNVARAVLEVIEAYIQTKKDSFEQFVRDCAALQRAAGADDQSVVHFIRDLLTPQRDARLFEIVSYAVLKYHYAEEVVFLGLTREDVHPEALKLFKTGRTNANDGGIDFVMRPLGRFFQVTETLDVKKYFLDIDKVERYPISFVVKTDLPVDEIRNRLAQGARQQYVLDAVVQKYMASIEEIINAPRLLEILDSVVENGHVHDVLDEILRWSAVEFNYVMSGTGQEGAADA